MENMQTLVNNFSKVYIQTHNHPDADAIASAWGLRKLVESFGKPVEIIYSGNHIFKPNIENMIQKYRIHMTIIGEGFEVHDNELLIIVDGQYKAGNVITVQAKNIIAIDHHLEERFQNYLAQDIQPRLGACTTLVYNYLKEFQVPIDISLATVLYFGIFMDTDMFTGKMTTLDNDAKKELEALYDKKVIDYLRLSSMSFDDVKIYANGILKTERYNGIIFSAIEECDDNLLGHISDLLSEIDGIEIVVIYSVRSGGYKLSIRSYHDFLTAEDLVKELTEGIGSGGGHQNKAGGFILKERFEQVHPRISVSLYIRAKVIDYYREVRLLETGKDNPFAIYPGQFAKAAKKKIYLRYINLKDHFIEDVSVKTLEGATTATANDKVIIGVRSEIWPISEELFLRKYHPIEDKSIHCLSDDYLDEFGVTIQSATRNLRITKENIKMCSVCRTSDDALVDAMPLHEKVKIRTQWGDFTGKPGDYLLINSLNDFYICNGEIFDLTYDFLKN